MGLLENGLHKGPPQDHPHPNNEISKARKSLQYAIHLMKEVPVRVGFKLPRDTLDMMTQTCRDLGFEEELEILDQEFGYEYDGIFPGRQNKERGRYLESPIIDSGRDRSEAM